MKKTYYSLLSLVFTVISQLSSANLHAQAPPSFNYQAVARNASGAPLVNSGVAIRVSIHSGTATGPVVYSERITATTNAFGLFTASIGTGNVISGTFAAIDWAGADKYMQVDLDPTGGNSYTTMGTAQLLSVPYAFYSNSSGGSFWNASGNNISNSNSGNTGIGIASPESKLHIKSPSPGAQLQLGNTNQPDFEWQFRVNGTGNLTLANEGNGSTLNAMFWENNYGYVGVGTVSPESRFHIVSAPGSTAAQLQLGNYNQPGYEWLFYVNGSGGLALTSEGNGTPVTATTWDPVTGNTGFGTALPSYRIHATTSAGSRAVFGENTLPGNNNGVGVYGKSTNNPGYGEGVIGEGSFRGVEGFCAATTYTGTAYGVYGVATGTTGTRTGVLGTANGGTFNYGVYCNGSGGYTGTWTLISDRKFKKDIEPVSAALTLVGQLNPVSYHLKADEYPMFNFPAFRQYGFIAQELEEVIPDLVEKGTHPNTNREENDIELKAINYTGMIPVLTKAIQEQQALIEQLQKQVDELKKK